MNLNFAAVIAQLGAGAAFRIARAARAAADYLFNTLLPDREVPSYHVDSGSMTIRPTMPGLVGMDSPYPPGGAIEVSTFLEQTAKLAHEVPMTEQALRHLQQMLMHLQVSGADTNERMLQEALNFLDKVIIQPHLDVREWLKGQALAYGAIDWKFNKKELKVDYGIPANHKLPKRTGNDAYHGSTSKFWDDVRQIRRLLRRYSEVRIIAHPDTVEAAQYNPANNMATIAEGDGSVTFRRWSDPNNRVAFSPDANDQVTILKYGLEGEILLPNGQTAVVPFLDRGVMVGVGIGRRRGGYVVGQGAADDPLVGVALGYGHVAPTVEGGGVPGLWADLYTPENRPWQLIGRAAQNFLPVIEDPDAVVIASTEMP